MATTNFSEWQSKFTGQCEIIVKADREVFFAACTELFDRIVERTPIGNPSLWKPPYWPKDYTPGALREAWGIEYTNNSVTIFNDKPYAYRVETGWSSQAPSGMMRISVMEFPSTLDEMNRKYGK